MTDSQSPVDQHAKEMFTLLAKKWLGTLIRTLIVGIGAWMKASGRFQFVDSAAVNSAAAMAPDLAGDVLLGAGVAWSALQKWRETRKLGKALAAPAGSTLSDLKPTAQSR